MLAPSGLFRWSSGFRNKVLDRVLKLCIMRTSSLLWQPFFKKMNNR
jgi:hypothetical protein